MKDDITCDCEWPLKVISGTVNSFIDYISKIQHLVSARLIQSPYGINAIVLPCSEQIWNKCFYVMRTCRQQEAPPEE